MMVKLQRQLRRRWLVVAGLVPLLALTAFGGRKYGDELFGLPGWQPSHRVDVALSAEDWATVAVELRADGPALPAPARFVRAHALLALNRGNEAVCQFMAASPADLELWRRWTQACRTRHPGAPVAWYLAGDGFARQGRWDEALATFGEGLARAPEDALLHNARGTVYTALHQWSPAFKDFEHASASNPTFAEPFAGRGMTYLLQQTGGAPGALKAFDAALALAPNSALARNGRGSARLIVAPAGDESAVAAAAALAGQDFAAALTDPGCAAVGERVRANLAASGGHIVPAEGSSSDGAPGADPGNTVTTTFRAGLEAGIKTFIPDLGIVDARGKIEFERSSTDSYGVKTGTSAVKAAGSSSGASGERGAGTGTSAVKAAGSSSDGNYVVDPGSSTTTVKAPNTPGTSGATTQNPGDPQKPGGAVADFGQARVDSGPW